MRQQTQVSRVLPFSFEYQGAHPAGVWLAHALQKHCFHVATPPKSPHYPLIYALDQSFLSDLAEPTLLFPLEWCEQSLTGHVTYSGSSEAQIVDSSTIAVACLDLEKLSEYVLLAFESYVAPSLPCLEETQPLSLVWEWRETVLDVKAPGGQRWCVSGELPVACTAFGVLQTHTSESVTIHFCYRPGTQTTAFTAEVLAEDSAQAVKKLLENDVFSEALAKSGVINEDWLQQRIKRATLIWPEISWEGTRILIASQKPDLRPASLKIEGYCWGLMTHLFYYLNMRYSSPEAVFYRLQNFDQKMRGVLSPFL